MSLIVCIFNILELNNHLNENIYVINYVNCISQSQSFIVVKSYKHTTELTNHCQHFHN
jgi:hypothetical protein